MPIAEPQAFPEKIGEIIIDCPHCNSKLQVELYGIKNYPRKRPKVVPSRLVSVKEIRQ